MRKITIDNKEYTIEYTIAASLYNECIETIMNTLVGAEMITSSKEEVDAARNAITQMSNIPQTAITLMYAGLLEHHGNEWGDGTVNDRKDAMKLAATYIKENNSNWYALLDELMTEVSNDNFFELTGINQMISRAETVAETVTKKKTRKRTGDNS